MTEQKRQTVRLDKTAQADETKKDLLSELSMPAVIAATLGSVTSFMLSNKLGIAGSLIGAGITSAVSTLTVQLSKPMITSSVEKIQDISTQKHDVTPDGKRAGTHERGAIHDGAHFAAEGAPEAHAGLVRKHLVAVGILAALGALLVYTILVSAATQGKGIGPTPDDIATPVIQEQGAPQQDTTAQTDTSAATSTSTTSQQQTTDATSTDAADATTTSPSEAQTDATQSTETSTETTTTDGTTPTSTQTTDQTSGDTQQPTGTPESTATPSATSDSTSTSSTSSTPAKPEAKTTN